MDQILQKTNEDLDKAIKLVRQDTLDSLNDLKD